MEFRLLFHLFVCFFTQDIVGKVENHKIDFPLLQPGVSDVDQTTSRCKVCLKVALFVKNCSMAKHFQYLANTTSQTGSLFYPYLLLSSLQQTEKRDFTHHYLFVFFFFQSCV